MLSKRLIQLKDLTRKLKPLLKKYDVLEDIIIFGSFVKEKIEPKDIDIALFVSKIDEKLIENIKNEIIPLIKNLKIDFTILSIKQIYSGVWLSLLKEGYSIGKENFLYKIYKIQPLIMYKYNLSSLTAIQKVQFSRGLNKILKDTTGIKLSRTIILIPISYSEMFEEFLKTWKIEYETKKYELLPELIKSI
ncbi:MAG: nucleotidyltransferase domain-containing protein [Nanoarchaeota archaeon]